MTAKTSNHLMADSYSGILLAAVAALALLFFYSPGTSDVQVDLQWITHAGDLGFRAGYAANEDSYPPLVPWTLYSISQIGNKFNVDPSIDLKIALYFWLYATGFAFLWCTKNYQLTALLVFSLILNSVALEYLDIFVAPTLILAFWALRRYKIAWFTALFVASCLFKFQPLIVAPFILIYLVDATQAESRRAGLARFSRSVILPTLAVLIPCFAVFGIEIFKALGRAFTYHPQLSANATNFNWIVTYLFHLFLPAKYGALIHGRPDLIEDPSISILCRAFFGICYLWSLAQFVRQKKTFEALIVYSILGYMAYFTFNVGVHENHLFLPMILSLFLAALNRSYLSLSLAIALIANLNLLVFYGIDGNGLPFDRVVGGVDLSLLVAFLEVLFFLRFAWVVSKARLTVPATQTGPEAMFRL
jgi:hypothetical protein